MARSKNNNGMTGLLGASVAGNVATGGPGASAATGMFFGACSKGAEDQSLFCKGMQMAMAIQQLLFIIFACVLLFMFVAFVRGGGLQKLYRLASNIKF